MTAVLEEPEVRDRKNRKRCSTCDHEPTVKRRSRAIPKEYPRNLRADFLADTFERHPWLENTSVGALAQSLRDAVVSGA